MIGFRGVACTRFFFKEAPVTLKPVFQRSISYLRPFIKLGFKEGKTESNDRRSFKFWQGRMKTFVTGDGLTDGQMQPISEGPLPDCTPSHSVTFRHNPSQSVKICWTECERM